MQAETYTWNSFDEKFDAIALDNEDWYLVGAPLDDDDVIRLTQDKIRAELAILSIVFEPALFSATISNQAIISHISMSLGRAQMLMIQHVKCFTVSFQTMI